MQECSARAAQRLVQNHGSVKQRPVSDAAAAIAVAPKSKGDNAGQLGKER